MESFEKEIRQHNIDRQVRIGSQFDSFLKGPVAQEGEVRTHGNQKMVKRGGKWVPLNQKKTPDKRSDPTPKKESSKKDQDKSGETVPEDTINRQEIAKLTTIKNTYKTEPHRAYELAETLSDEAKNIIPQNIWNKMSAASHKENGKEEAKDE